MFITAKLLYSTLTHDNICIKQHYIRCVAIYKESKIYRNLSWLNATSYSCALRLTRDNASGFPLAGSRFSWTSLLWAFAEYVWAETWVLLTSNIHGPWWLIWQAGRNSFWSLFSILVSWSEFVVRKLRFCH